MKKVFLTLLLALAQSGCLAGSLAVDAGNLAKLSAQKRPIAKVVQDPALAPETRRKLELVNEAKRYAAETLGLNVKKNYASYVDVGRPVLSWTLQAAAPLKLEGYSWKFPLVGSLPYMGFFNKEQGLKTKRKLEARGYDALLRPVPTFALPLFSDPVTSCMLQAPDAYLVNLVIHETCHNTIMLKNQSAFNENLCEWVGNQGAIAFAEDRYGADADLTKYARGFQRDAARYTAFISALAAKLNAVYASPLADAEKRERKAEIFRQAKSEYQKLCAAEMETDYFRRYLDFPWNNALVVYSQLYFQDQAVFAQVFQAQAGNLRDTLEFLKGLEQIKTAPVPYLEQWLEGRKQR